MAEKWDIRALALTSGIVFAILHLIGVILILATSGGVFEFWLSNHFVSLSVSIAPFNFINLITGVVLAFIVGAVSGAAFGWLYNYLLK